jgi:ribose transport system ATP-binding protein
LVCSSDTDELVTLCNRVLVLRDGRLTAQVSRDSLTEEHLVRESLGVPGAAATVDLGPDCDGGGR